MFFIQELRPALDVQLDSIRAKVFNKVFNFYLVFNWLLIISSLCMFVLSVYTSKKTLHFLHAYIYIFIVS